MSRVSVRVERHVLVPAARVSSYVLDFENAREWMVGVENIRRTAEDAYRLAIETPIGRLEPAATIVEARPELIRWVYTETVDGDGQVEVLDHDSGCLVRYRGDFRVRGRLLGRAARLAGMEGFVRRQGERSLERLKHLMEAGRYA